MICAHPARTEVGAFDGEILWICNDCRLIFSDKYWQSRDIPALYDNFYYKNEIVGRFNSWLEYIIRAFRFFRAFKIFTINPRARTILDIGSGRGFTLFYLKKYYGYRRTAGTQVSRNAFEFSRDKLGLEMYDRDLLDLSLEPGSFEIITLWHVLEHVRDPEGYVERIHNLLTDDGRLVIEVPNFRSWTRKFTGQYWLGLDLEYHLYFFTPEALSQLLNKHGYQVTIEHTFSLEYSTFFSVQSIVSHLTRSRHLIFQFLQDGKMNWRIPFHILLFAVLIPVCLAINLVLYFSKKGEILLVTAKKKKRGKE